MGSDAVVLRRALPIVHGRTIHQIAYITCI
jgi:hypothetical protein